MRRAPSIVAITALYLGLSSLGIYIWLWRSIPALPGYAAWVCALPLALFWLATRKHTLTARERIVRSLACLMFFPFLLLLWGTSGSVETAPEPVREPAGETLRTEPLLAGAIARQDLAPAAGQSFSGASATFGDGSELRVYHFASEREATKYLALVSDAFHARDATLAGRKGKSAQLATSLRVYWELHGRSLLELHASNEASLRARIEAQHIPLPRSSLPAPAERAASEAKPLFVVGAAVGHLMLLCLFVFWAAAATSRVQAQVQVAPLSARALLARFDALPALGVRCAVDPGASEHARVIHLHVEQDTGRAHRLTVTVDEPGRVVRSVEVQSAKGVAPRNEEEASMRAIGDPSSGVLRPRAQGIWNVKWLVTSIEPERLSSLPLSFADGRPQLPQGYGATLDADGIIHLVCALVTSAGFDYQPYLLFFQGGSAEKP